MKSKIEILIREIENNYQEKELGFTKVLIDSPDLIKMLESGIYKLKSLISEYIFDNQMEEIHFFKVKKPLMTSKLIYHKRIYHIELMRFPLNSRLQRRYIKEEMEQIKVFAKKNAEFIRYYRSGQTCFDEYYFLRGNLGIDLNSESFYFERDSRFSTNFDFKVAKLLANDKLSTYLNCELSKLKNKKDCDYNINKKSTSVVWTDKKTALAEIIYGIYEEKSVNGGNIEIKTIASVFCDIFNIDLRDIYHIFLEIRNRKTNRTEYLNRLIKSLNNRMDEADSK